MSCSTSDGATSRQQARRGRGSLRISDLGYFNVLVFAAMMAADEYFLSRLQFGTSDHILGYAAITVQDVPHPLRKSHKRRPYLLITQAAIASGFQGVSDPVGGRNYAREMFDELASIAREKGCAGLYLNVRKENARARRFYDKFGFQEDGEYHSDRMDADMVRERLVF